MPEKLFTSAEQKEINESERTIVGYASKEVIDRDNELIQANTWDLVPFKSNPVLMLGHAYSKPPIGKVLWTKKDKDGLKFKAQFANSQEAEEIFQLYKDGFMKAFSVGFIPKKWEDPGDDDDKSKLPRRIYTKAELLEISCVAIPSCREALIDAYEHCKIKSKSLTKVIEDMTGADTKTVIPYKDLGKAAEGAKWDAAAEVRAADVANLKLMCTWYNSEEPDVKGSYKLPHHKASGGHAAVWRGVAAAMGALLGARGGVAIPGKDRKGVYSHLTKHYKQFEKTPPEFREYSEEELYKIDDCIQHEIRTEDYYEDLIAEWSDTIHAIQVPKGVDLDTIIDRLDQMGADIAELRSIVESNDGDTDDDEEIDAEALKTALQTAMAEVFKADTDTDTNDEDDNDGFELPTPAEILALARGELI